MCIVRHGFSLSMLLCIAAAEVLPIFIDANTRIKRVQVRDHEIKLVNLADDFSIFLRDINCLNRIHLNTKKLFQKNFSNSQA